MRTTTKYEEICAEYIHRKANKDNWPFYDPVTYLNLLGMGEELTGKEYICIWQREEEVITKECGCIDDEDNDEEVLLAHINHYRSSYRSFSRIKHSFATSSSSSPRPWAWTLSGCR